jgi:hypothetical protein
MREARSDDEGHAGIGVARVVDAVGMDAQRPKTGPAAEEAAQQAGELERERDQVAPDQNPQASTGCPGDAPSQSLQWAVQAVARCVRPVAGNPAGMGVGKYVTVGALAGAAGSTALNAATWVDMAVRARPASSTPEQAAERLAEKAGVEVPGDDDQRQNRLSGLGALLGTGAGVGVGTLLGLARGTGWRPGAVVGTVVAGGLAMAASDGTMTALGLTDPRQWDAKTWATDLVPHLVYGAVTTLALRAWHRP